MNRETLQKIKAFGSWAVDNKGADLHSAFTKKLTDVHPDERQLSFMEMEYYNFIHFGINTFYGREWGNGTEDPRHFNPTHLDTDQWCEVIKATGSKGIVLTAKHHDGFCLFDTKYTDHSVMHSPFGKDILAMLKKSCDKYDLKLGVYLSPWDRHEKTYGTEEYNDYFVNQLTELCTGYGELFCLWFDGACGEGKNGKKQHYDWKRYYRVISELQPKAVISITGPDVRWIGNEGGRVRKSEWSVIADYDEDTVAEKSQQDLSQAKELLYRDETHEDLGSRKALKGCESLVFRPAEADVSINMGWFHTSNPFAFARKGRSAKKLSEIYFSTVGGNASMLLNIPPNKKGLIGRSEIRRLKKFTQLINAPFKNEIFPKSIYNLSISGEERKISAEPLRDDEIGIIISFESTKTLSTVTIRENLTYGQRTEEFKLLAVNGNEVKEIYCGTVIGSKKIIRLNPPAKAEKLIVIPTMSRENPTLREIRIFR